MTEEDSRTQTNPRAVSGKNLKGMIKDSLSTRNLLCWVPALQWQKLKQGPCKDAGQEGKLPVLFFLHKAVILLEVRYELS